MQTADRVSKHMSERSSVKRRVCADPERRARLEGLPIEWLAWYLGRTYTRPFEAPHEAIINGAVQASDKGEWFVVGAERGLGKSVCLWGVILYLKLSGREDFPVCLPWAASALNRAMRFWKNQLCFNERLAADYPEYCAPFVHSRGMSQRLAATHWEDSEKLTGAQMAIGDGMIVFPDSLGCIGGSTINGNPRGLNHSMPDGRVLRPTIALLDDVQDRSVAKSEAQVASTIAIIDGDVAGMGEAGTRMPMLMSGNCIAVNDVMSHYLSSKEWRTLRMSCVESWPDGWNDEDGAVRDLWKEWHELASYEDTRPAADAFFAEHKERMIAGFKLSAPLTWRINGVDAGDEYRAVMREYFKLGEHAFAAERQQEPISDRPEAEYTLTAEVIRKQIGPLARGVIPEDVASTVAFVDLNYHAAAWCVVSASNVPCYSVVDYGWWTPGRGQPVWKEKGAKQALEVSIYRACESVVQMILKQPYAGELKGIAIDCGSKWASTVHAACKQLMARHNPPPVYAAKGFSGSQYREPYKRATIKRRGHMSDVRYMSPDREQMLHWDSHAWHMITQRGWLVPIGMPGSVCLFAATGRMSHAQFAEEAAADILEGTQEKNGKTQAVWKTTGRNEMGDVVAGAAALLSTEGIRPDAADASKTARRAAKKARKEEIKKAKAAKKAAVEPAKMTPVPPIEQETKPRVVEHVKPMRSHRASWAVRW